MGALPPTLGQVHARFETPYNAAIATTAATILLALSGALRMLAALTSASILGVYLAACLAVLRRKTDSSAFHLPGAKVIAAAGAITVIWLLAHVSAREIAAVSGTVIAGVVYRMAAGRRRVAQN